MSRTPTPRRTLGYDPMRGLRRILGFLGTAALGGAVSLLAVYIWNAAGMPDLDPWHDPQLEEDFREGILDLHIEFALRGHSRAG